MIGSSFDAFFAGNIDTIVVAKIEQKEINIMVISTSEIKISVLISNKDIKKAVACLHKEFNLD